MSETRVDIRGHPRGGRVATVCHDDADKLNVIDGDGAGALSAAIERAAGSTTPSRARRT